MQFIYIGVQGIALLFISAIRLLKKILKACIVENKNKIPEKIHQLDKLAKNAGLDLPSGWDEDLAEITRHFWRVRYPDFRRFVYKSKKQVEPTIDKTKEVFLWVLEKLNQ